MATILLAAAGSAFGSGFGGAVFGLSGAVIGRAVGATLGRVIDQRLMGAGSGTVETGKVERFRLTGASEGAAIGRVWGRARVAGQVIWASRFQEMTNRSGGGKGAAQPSTTAFSYSVSLAIALCEGEITRVGRIWADGEEIAPTDLTLRVYPGSQTQMPDPKMEAVEGAGLVPAYRGTAYVVIEDLALARYGNRVPQLTFEVVRPARAFDVPGGLDLASSIRGVALIPGSGEYALATTPVRYDEGLGVYRTINVNSPSGVSDFETAISTLTEELPACGSASLVVSWFGNDLRCAQCEIRPKVEQIAQDPASMPWRVAGVPRATAATVVQQAGRPVYGGTPADASVVEAITALQAAGKDVVFYPFILMEQLPGNTLPDPWTGTTGQPALPWRGRITLSVAPGQTGTPDRTAAATAEVASFFGLAEIADFQISGGSVQYSGPAEWSYRRFILHYAHLAVAAGGVDAFLIGSELRSLTQIRGAGDNFAAVAELRRLAADVRAVLGPAVKIGYAADWSEYSGYSDGSGNRYFHLDPLWSDPAIDFVGIDNYMPLSDWRDGVDHADAAWGSIYNLSYLMANVAGGEGYDWYYASPEATEAQIRTPIADGAYGEPWVYRYKDIRSWWENPHHDRLDGIRQATQTGWVPQSKPIWFTEYGCPAVDKGSNEPNRFVDVKSTESGLPRSSTGLRDDLIQMQYLRATLAYWANQAANPVSPVYGTAMVDMARAHVWAWDTRPFPQFPNALATWSDGANYARGHWISGRVTAQPLAVVVAEICTAAGLDRIDVTRLYGLVRGYLAGDSDTARATLQPLMLAYGFDAVERDGFLRFSSRDGELDAVLDPENLMTDSSLDGDLATERSPAAEVAGRVRLVHIEADGDYEVRAAEAVFPDEQGLSVAQSDLQLVLTRSEGQRIVERWLSESRVARDSARFALPPSQLAIGAGDVVSIGASGQRYRVDRVEIGSGQIMDAVRIEPAIYIPSDATDELLSVRPFAPPVPVYPLFLDLPLLRGDEVAHAPHAAITATPWPGSVAIYSAPIDAGYGLNTLISRSAVIGITETAMSGAHADIWDRGPALRVKVYGGTLASADSEGVLNGANVAAIGNGNAEGWEVFQFESALLVAPDTYELTNRLRGQAGTEADIPPQWPVGSRFVLLDGNAQQITLALSERGLARHYRIGSALRPLDDPSYIHKVEAFRGIGLRPYAPAQIRAAQATSGDIALSWVRRTRIDGDTWEGVEVPLGEDREAYLIRVIRNDIIMREATVSVPVWTYSATLQALDGAISPFALSVAQISDRFGPGPFTRIEING